MIGPGALVLLSPLVVGFLFGSRAVSGLLAGSIVSGVQIAVSMSNSGGAWDNAKKSFEAGVEINGEMTFKGSDAHKAAVTGDTVGDPFKDTSGPSMNILIKLTCLVGLVIAPILGNGHASEGKNPHCEKKMSACCAEKKEGCSEADMCKSGMQSGKCKEGAQMIGKCDMSKCATMTKDQCMKYCDSIGCSKEEKEACGKMYGADGKFNGSSASCCKKESKECCGDPAKCEKKEASTKSCCKDKGH